VNNTELEGITGHEFVSMHVMTLGWTANTIKPFFWGGSRKYYKSTM
jgi:hypothetical protein